MLRHFYVVPVVLLFPLVGAAQQLSATALDDVQQAAMKVAVARVAPSVVQMAKTIVSGLNIGTSCCGKDNTKASLCGRKIELTR